MVPQLRSVQFNQATPRESPPRTEKPEHEEKPNLRDLPDAVEVAELTWAAIRALPISSNGLVVDGQLHPGNPDQIEYVLGLFEGDDSEYISRQWERDGMTLAQMPPSTSTPALKLVTGAAFGREYDRPSHRVLFVMTPVLSGDMTTGLVVAQIEEASPSGAVVNDHWVLMARAPSGPWQRRPIPLELRSLLYLTDETGGAL
jgi:hypothetical protein